MQSPSLRASGARLAKPSASQVRETANDASTKPRRAARPVPVRQALRRAAGPERSAGVSAGVRLRAVFDGGRSARGADAFRLAAKFPFFGSRPELASVPELDTGEPGRVPSAEAPPAPEEPAARAGPLGRLAAFLRVLPERERNGAFWKYVIGQALLSLGDGFHYTALPSLLSPNGESSARVGLNRAADNGAQAVSSLTMGPVIDRSSVRRLLAWAFFGRALLMASVPLLFFHGHFTFAAFQLIIFASGFLRDTAGTAGMVALQRIMGSHKGHYNRANAIYSFVLQAVGAVGPLLAGALIVSVDLWLGPLSGSAVAYGVAALLALAVAVGYRLFLKVPGDGPAPAPKAGGKARPLREITEGFRLNWSDRFLRLTLLFSTLDLLTYEAFLFTALPRHIQEGLAVTEPIKAGAFGFYLAAWALAVSLASLAMTLRRAKPEAARREGRLDPLERQALATSILHGLGTLAYLGVFLSGSLWLSVGIMFLAALLQAPAMVVWESLHQRVRMERYPDRIGTVIAARGFYAIALSVVGLLLFGALFSVLPSGPAFWVLAASLAVIAGLHIVEPFVVLGERKEIS